MPCGYIPIRPDLSPCFYEIILARGRISMRGEDTMSEYLHAGTLSAQQSAGRERT